MVEIFLFLSKIKIKIKFSSSEINIIYFYFNFRAQTFLLNRFSIILLIINRKSFLMHVMVIKKMLPIVWSHFHFLHKKTSHNCVCDSGRAGPPFLPSFRLVPLVIKGRRRLHIPAKPPTKPNIQNYLGSGFSLAMAEKVGNSPPSKITYHVFPT